MYREKKRCINGQEREYECRLLYLDDEVAIVVYPIRRHWSVGSLMLRPGMISYGFFWKRRPYVLYKWFDERGEKAGDYFSVAQSIEVHPQEVMWKDLVLDLLVLPEGKIEVLDEEEVPSSIDVHTLGYIRFAQKEIVSNWRKVVRETDILVDSLRRRVLF